MKQIKLFQNMRRLSNKVSNNKEIMWAPWRMDYVSCPSPAEDKKNIFLDKLSLNDDESALILFRGKFSFVLMNLYPYNNGHLMVVPFNRVDSIHKLDNQTMLEIMQLSSESMEIIKEVMKPTGFNFGANIGKSSGAGIEDHLHFHIVPRWDGDTNFMPVVGNTKVMVQGLVDSYNKLKPFFEKLSL